MGEYIKLFNTHAEYQAFVGGGGDSPFVRPNVSHCITENEVHYSPQPNMLEVTFNVTSLENPTSIVIRPQPLSVEIDGVIYLDVTTVGNDGEGYNENGWYYQFDTLGEHTIKYEMPGDRINGGLYYNEDIIEIKVPEGIKYISQYSFEDNPNLSAVTLPNSLEGIEHHVFTNCTSLPTEGNIRYADTIAVECTDKTQTTYQLKNGTRFLMNWLFENCTNLTTLTIPSTLAPYGFGNPFRGCTSLTNITIPRQIKRLDNSAFDGCTALTSVTFESGSELEELWGSVFYNCSSLQHLEFPSTLIRLSNAEFNGCTSLVDITFNSVVPPELNDGTIITSNQTFTIYVPAQSVDAYKAANRWSVAANRIQAIQ